MKSSVQNYEGSKVSSLCAVLCLVAQSCPTLCNPMDNNPPGSSVHRDSPGKNTGVGYHALLQGIFLTQGLNPGFPHCGQILYCLSCQGSPRILKQVAMPSSRMPSQCRNQTGSPALKADSLPAELHVYVCVCVLFLVAQSCLTLCDFMVCSPPGSSVHGDSLSTNAGVGCHALLQGSIYLAVYLFLYKLSMVIQF